MYARLSKDSERNGAGVERQLQDARELARLRGYRVAAEHVDNDLSAAGSKRRPGFEALLADLAEGQADVLVAWAWDRLSRNRRDTMRLMEAGQAAKITVALVKGSDVDMCSASGRMVAGILAEVAKAEIDVKAERQRSAELQRAKAGAPASRRAFGYQRDGTPHPVEAPAVAGVFADFLAGATMAGIARRLNTAGHTSSRGRPWDDTGVRVVLTNRRYIAERCYRGAVYQGSWPALVDVDTFESVQTLIGSRGARRPASRYLGGALYECHCGQKATGNYDVHGRRTYRCPRYHMQRNAERVDELVLRVIAARLRRGDLVGLLARDDTGAGVQLGRTIIGLRARLDAIAVDYADGKITARQMQVAARRIDEKMAAAQSALAESGKTNAATRLAAEPDPAAAWLALPVDRQRAVLDALCTVVILPAKPGRGQFTPAEIRFDWRTP